MFPAVPKKYVPRLSAFWKLNLLTLPASNSKTIALPEKYLGSASYLSSLIKSGYLVQEDLIASM